MTPVSLTPWQRTVPWGRKSTAPIGSRLGTATICRQDASISMRSPKTKRLAAQSAFVNFQLGLEKSCLLSNLSLLQLFTSHGDIRTGRPNSQVLQALLITALLLLLQQLHTVPQRTWLTAIAMRQLAFRLKVLLPLRSSIHLKVLLPLRSSTRLKVLLPQSSSIPTLWHSLLPISIFQIITIIWLSSVRSLKLVSPSSATVPLRIPLRTTNSVQLKTVYRLPYTINLRPMS